MILPIYKVEHSCILSRQGDVTVGFAVQLPEIFTLSDREYETYHQAWVKAIKLLSAGSVFHKQDWTGLAARWQELELMQLNPFFLERFVWFG